MVRELLTHTTAKNKSISWRSKFTLFCLCLEKTLCSKDIWIAPPFPPRVDMLFIWNTFGFPQQCLFYSFVYCERVNHCRGSVSQNCVRTCAEKCRSPPPFLLTLSHPPLGGKQSSVVFVYASCVSFCINEHGYFLFPLSRSWHN